MIGKVIEGRYEGASVNKLSDRNILYVQTEDGTKVTLSKSNTISIDDVTEQYPSAAKKTIMVLWDNFETSIKGLYSIGDGGGLTRGLIMASASGVQMARILKNIL